MRQARRVNRVPCRRHPRRPGKRRDWTPTTGFSPLQHLVRRRRLIRSILVHPGNSFSPAVVTSIKKKRKKKRQRSQPAPPKRNEKKVGARAKRDADFFYSRSCARPDSHPGVCHCRPRQVTAAAVTYIHICLDYLLSFSCYCHHSVHRSVSTIGIAGLVFPAIATFAS